MFETIADNDLDLDLIFNETAKLKQKNDAKAPHSPIERAPNIEAFKKPILLEKCIKTHRKPMKRKFPGPAGLLPDLKDFEPTNLTCPDLNEEIPCSQRSFAVFQGGPWSELARLHSHFTEKYSIKWIKAKAASGDLKDQKLPFLGALVENVEVFEARNPIITLKDCTGSIQGTILRSVFDEYGDDLVDGAAIVLKQCGVVSTGDNSNHHLTIGPKNLVTIFRTTSKSDETIKTISVQEISIRDLNESVCDNSIARFSEFGESSTSIGSFQLEKVAKLVEKPKLCQEKESIWDDSLDNIDYAALFGDL